MKYLTPEPIRIIENHFELPMAITDQLKAPASYPVPVIRLALREMSLVWFLYGGKDFDQSTTTQTKKLGPQNRLNSAPGNFIFGSAFFSHFVMKYFLLFLPAKLGDTKSLGSQADADQQSKSPAWLRRGGPGRDHSILMEIHLNKVQCKLLSHSSYFFNVWIIKGF